MNKTLRNGFFAGLLIALIVGAYLYRLWQPERQVQLHSVHLLNAIEAKNWSDVAEFVRDSYADRWGQDRNLLLARFRAVFPFARNLHLQVIAPATRADATTGEWSARITVEAEANEVTEMIKQRVNSLDAPFSLQWQRTGKPWEWRLVRIDNDALEIRESPY